MHMDGEIYINGFDDGTEALIFICAYRRPSYIFICTNGHLRVIYRGISKWDKNIFYVSVWSLENKFVLTLVNTPHHSYYSC